MDIARDASRDDGGVGKTRRDATRGLARRVERRCEDADATRCPSIDSSRRGSQRTISASASNVRAPRGGFEEPTSSPTAWLTGRYERDDAFDPEAYERRLALIDNPELATEGTSGREERGAEEESEEEEAETERGGGEKLDETPEEQVTVKGKKKKFDPVKKAWEKARVAREEREAQKKAFLEEKARRAAYRSTRSAERDSIKRIS